MRPLFVLFPARRRGRAAAISVAAAASVLGAAAPSDAGDQRITGSLSQTFLADTNLRVQRRAGGSDDGGISLGSISRLSLNYANLTPSARLTLGTGLSYSAFTGDQGSNLDGLFPSLNGAYQVQRSTRTLGFSFSGSVRPVEYSDLGLILIPGDIGDPIDPDDDVGPSLEIENRQEESLRISLGGGVSYNEQINSAQSLSLGANVSHQSFTKTTANLRTSTQLSGNAGWDRKLTTRASAGVSSFTSIIASGDSAEQMTYTAALTPTFRYAETPDIVYSASLGPSVSYISGTLPNRSTEQGFSLGLRGSAGFTYVGDLSRTSISLSQSVVPNDEGVPVNQTSLGASYNRRITATSDFRGSLSARLNSPLSDGTSRGNEGSYGYAARGAFTQRIDSYSRANVGVSATFTDDGDQAETIYGASAGYTYSLTSDVNASLSYDFRAPTGDDAEDVSHRVSLTLSHAFTLLP